MTMAQDDESVTAIQFENSSDDEDDEMLGSPVGSPLYDFVGSTGLALGRRRAGRPPECWGRFDAIVNCGVEEYAGMEIEERHGYYLHLPGEGREGEGLGGELPAAIRFAARHLARRRKVLIHSEDVCEARAVAVLVAVLASCFDGSGAFRMALLAALPYLDDPGVRDAVSLPRGLLSPRLLCCLGWTKKARPAADLERAALRRLAAFFEQQSPREKAPPPPPRPRRPATTPSPPKRGAATHKLLPTPRPVDRAPRKTWEPPSAMSFRAPSQPDDVAKATSSTFLFCCPGV